MARDQQRPKRRPKKEEDADWFVKPHQAPIGVQLFHDEDLS